MRRIILTICLCLTTLPAVCEPRVKYEVATIIDVKPHEPSVSGWAGAKYEVSVKVADTTYVVLYTDTFGTTTVQYALGREVLVHVEKNSITYNDILGQSHQVPIISQKLATNTKQLK